MGCKCNKDSADKANVNIEENMIEEGELSKAERVDDSKVEESKVEDSKVEDSKVEESKVEESKIGKGAVEFNEETFPSDVLAIINKYRKKPKTAAKKVERFKKYIKEEEGNLYFKRKGPKIRLRRGVEAFDEAIKYLEAQSGLHALDLNEDLVIPVTLESKEIGDPDRRAEVLKEGLEPILESYKEVEHYTDISVTDPETFAVLHIIDDSDYEGRRREMLFSDKFSSVGIGFKAFKKKLYAHFCFA